MLEAKAARLAAIVIIVAIVIKYCDSQPVTFPTTLELNYSSYSITPRNYHLRDLNTPGVRTMRFSARSLQYRICVWAMETHLRAELVLEALNMALGQRQPTAVIHHSDQGTQYTLA